MADMCIPSVWRMGMGETERERGGGREEEEEVVEKKARLHPHPSSDLNRPSTFK